MPLEIPVAADQPTMGSGRSHINGIENFWGHAKRRLKPYHGGFKRHAELFLYEMEFRFSHRRDAGAVDHIARLLRRSQVGK